MIWNNVKLIYLRELRDQLRDRRTIFTVLVLPLLLYPLMGMLVFQVQQFLKEHTSKVRIIGADALPQQPRLIDQGKLAAEFGDPNLLDLELVPQTRLSLEELRKQSQRDIQLGLCDVVVYFPADFSEQLAAFRNQPEDEPEAVAVPTPESICDEASDKSKVAKLRIDSVIIGWRDAMAKRNLKAMNVPPAAAHPFELKHTDVSQETRRRAAMWSKILPFVLMIWALTGAFYPAVDLCAGEKERGTLETLLSSPAARSEIVWGKLLTVMTFSSATSLLNLVSMTATGTFIVSQIQRMGAIRMPMELGPPPVAAVFWLVLALVPISALFSALSLAIAAFAKSSKEGQYYLMPLLMISLPLMMLPVLPAAELDLGFALIPLSGLMLLLRALIEAQYLEALRFAVPVVGVTAVCCLLAIRWAVDQFNNESVLFRESERFGIGLWIRHLVRDREDTPTVGEALLCGVLLLVLRFFFSLVAPPPDGWRVMATTTLVMLIAFIAGPACLMAIMLTRRPAKTLLLCPPSFAATVPVAGLLALLLHPAMLWLNEGIRFLYPISPAALVKLREFDAMFTGAPLWQALVVICLAPAICEELAFRGFILSGLRRMGHKWGAIVLSAALFGLAHGILQQSLGAAAIGVVIGYIAVKTGSILPGMLYHGVHNSLSVLTGRLAPELLDSQPLLRLIFDAGAEPGQVIYRWPAALIAALLAAIVLWWLKSLPYHRSAEERLQEALDSQPAAAPLHSVA
jgi:sodium transport system permease protein